MRADRLVATLLLLQTRGRVTAAEVAAELEVSLKTARRDLDALSLAGLPVYSQPGRGGGWQLLGGARTDLSGLTAAEARTLFLVAGPAATATPEVKSALRKLMRALPEPFRAAAEAAAEASLADPRGWGAASAADAPYLRDLQRAVIERVQVHLAYETEAGVGSERTVHPLGLATKGEVWYLIADTAAGRRTFRVDRIVSATLSDLPANRPQGFDLAAAWRETTMAIEEQRTRVRARVIADEAALGGLQVQFGADITIGQRLGDGRFEVQVGGRDSGQIAERLAGWGAAIEVVGPSAVRRRLGRIGAELVAAYGADGSGQDGGWESGQQMS